MRNSDDVMKEKSPVERPGFFCSKTALFVELEDGQESLGRDLDRAELAHFLLAFLLLLQQLLLAGDVAAVALGQHVLAHGPDRLSGDDLAADGRLDGHLEELARDVLLQLLAELAGAAVGLLPVGDEAQGP